MGFLLKLLVRYEIVELMSNTCILKMMMGGDSMDIKCEKR